MKVSLSRKLSMGSPKTATRLLNNEGIAAFFPHTLITAVRAPVTPSGASLGLFQLPTCLSFCLSWLLITTSMEDVLVSQHSLEALGKFMPPGAPPRVGMFDIKIFFRQALTAMALGIPDHS